MSRTITDMGKAYGRQTFHVSGNPTVVDLIREGIIIAIPDPHEGIIYKRPEKCSAIELAARLTVEEAAVITEDWNGKLDQESQ